MMYDFVMYDVGSLFEIWRLIYNAIKDPLWYTVQVSDTTMFTNAASLFGQKKYVNSYEFYTS